MIMHLARPPCPEHPHLVMPSVAGWTEHGYKRRAHRVALHAAPPPSPRPPVKAGSKPLPSALFQGTRRACGGSPSHALPSKAQGRECSEGS
mmetsp:Transcript_47000/g.123322  ORF Transcript_47000/g.123322 Transcript_47000/m.123322 type:complete len:91 (-) Transcript_47000:165-437(-)